MADNIGYLYAFNYKKNEILWAKNYKIPFSSNLKLAKNNLILSNQNNNLFFINKIDGNIIKQIPTEETTVKNNFKSNLSINQDSVLYLNTYGSLYSINFTSKEINWFLNLKDAINFSSNDLFFGSEVINSKSKIVVSSNFYTYIINSNNGSIDYKINFSSNIKPIILSNYLFAVTKNNFLVSIDINKKKIIYSYDIENKISEFLNENKKAKVELDSMFILNNNIYLFLKNSYFLQFDIRGNLENIKKLPKKKLSNLTFIDGNMLYLNTKGKLAILD